ncbi:MAG: gamma-glutamyl-gamma-aminobutyrate hydrolase family protein [Candidatus Solibacter usitatus]|nr:gamma-glutamyl-gamma-aminobutyrate hydrolase family protein [Candidatus Solibacter usitatus]
MPPRAGITYRFAEKLPPYADAVRFAGLEPVPILPPGPESLRGLDALLISGGNDLNPDLYGQQPHSEAEQHDDERDQMEIRLLRLALDADLPVLCICRGLQLMNVALGGSLIQHLPSTEAHRQRGIADAHGVRLEQSAQLSGIVGAGEFTVNSRHHQAVHSIGKGLVATAWSNDGVVEALELPGKRFAIAVQWHPEDRVPSHTPDTRLFQAFAAAARG